MSSEDNSFQEVNRSSFRVAEPDVAGVVNQAGDESNFTSYGENVAFDAEGHAAADVVALAVIKGGYTA